MEILGFGSLFVVQSIYSLFLIIDIANNSNRADVRITVPFVKPLFPGGLYFPIYMILLLGSVVQFISVLLITISVAYVYKKRQTIQLSYDSRVLLDRYKVIFVIATVLALIVTYAYSTNMKFGETGTDDIVKLILFLCIVGIFVLQKVDLFLANSFSSLLNTSVDG